jgi:uncharacterized protein with FMN-binding domain
MRRIVLWLASTVTIVVLLFGYHTSTNDVSAATPPSSTSSAPPPSSSSNSAKSYTGTVASTRWGPVQVQIAVSAGKITGVTVLQQPNGNHKDTEINDYALPILVQDTLRGQSADIDMVSGATVTSDGYLQSLQAALDEAGI